MYTRGLGGSPLCTPVGKGGYTLLHPWVKRLYPCYTRGYGGIPAMVPRWVWWYPCYGTTVGMYPGIMAGHTTRGSWRAYYPEIMLGILPGLYWWVYTSCYATRAILVGIHPSLLWCTLPPRVYHSIPPSFLASVAGIAGLCRAR